MKFLKRMTLKIRLMLLFGIIFNVFVLIMSVGLFNEGKKGMFKEFEIRGKEILDLVTGLSAAHYEKPDLPELVRMINSLNDINDVLAIEMYDRDGEIIIQSSDGNFEPLVSGGTELYQGMTLHRVLESDDEETSEFTRSVHAEGSYEKLGFIRILMDRNELLGTLQSFLYKIFATGVFASVLAIFATYYVISSALGALPDLLRALNEIANGNYRPRIDSDRADELGTIARSIEAMSEQISSAHNELSLLSEFPKMNPNPVFRLDGSGTITLANDAALAFFERDSLEKMNIADLITEVRDVDLQSLCQTGEKRAIEVQRNKRIFQFVLSGIKKFSVCHVYSFELTELREKDRQLVQSGKLAALGEMTSGVAHELNNPLQFIKGYNNRLLKKVKQGPVGQEAEQYLTRIDENCERMRKIINHFRNFSRESELGFEKIDVNSVLESSFVLMNEQLRLNNIQVEKDLSSEPLYTLGNANRLEQVIMNLVGNARDALEGCSEKKIQISTISEGDKIYISVRDTGSGIDSENIEKVFNPFFTTKEVGKGTGLGLSISHGIIREHKGMLHCHSTVGVGTEFKIELQAVQVDGKHDVA